MGTLKQLEERIGKLEELRNAKGDERSMNLNFLLSTIRQREGQIQELKGFVMGVSEYVHSKGLDEDYLDWINKKILTTSPQKGMVIPKDSQKESSPVPQEPKEIPKDAPKPQESTPQSGTEGKPDKA